MDHIWGWLTGLAVAAAVPLTLKVLKAKAGNAIAAWTSAQLSRGFSAIHDIGDADVREYLDAIALATIKLAEKKIPGPGHGADKKAFVIKALTDHVPLLRGQDLALADIVDSICIAEQDALKAIAAQQPAN